MNFTLASLADSLANVGDPAFAVDGQGVIIAWNLAAESGLGHSRADTLGRFCHELVRGKDVFGNPVCRCECLVRRNIRAGKLARRFRMHVRANDGHYVEVECATLCVRGSENEMAVLHLLNLWPRRARAPLFPGSPGATHASQPARPALTARQTEVLELIAAGKSTRKIAEMLFLSPGTVRTHVEKILQKLGAHSRLEAVITASREGII